MDSRSPAESLDDVLELMSTEHRQLSENIDRIKSAIGSQDLSVIRRDLLQLQSSEQLHFSHEEEIMEQYNYPDIISHKKIHNEMIETLNNINRTVIIENLHRISADLGKYLEESLRQILQHDNDLRDFLLNRKKIAC